MHAHRHACAHTHTQCNSTLTLRTPNSACLFLGIMTFKARIEPGSKGANPCGYNMGIGVGWSWWLFWARDSLLESLRSPGGQPQRQRWPRTVVQGAGVRPGLPVGELGKALHSAQSPSPSRRATSPSSAQQGWENERGQAGPWHGCPSGVPSANPALPLHGGTPITLLAGFVGLQSPTQKGSHLHSPSGLPLHEGKYTGRCFWSQSLAKFQVGSK